MENPKYSLFKLYADHDLILFLIKKQLEGARFFHELRQVGFSRDEDCFDLGDAILSLMGYEEQSDELWEKYYHTLSDFAVKLDPLSNSSSEQLALEFYCELVDRKP